MALLQGILTARLLRGETRDAYLALDTALRLYPDQVPARFFFLFFEERPLLEAYAVFAIACRGGIVLPANQLGGIMRMLRLSSDMTWLTRHTLALRAMLSMSYMYMGAGGQVTQNVVSELIIATTQLLRVKGIANVEAGEKDKLVNEVMDIIRSMVTIFARYGATPGIAAFNSIITNLGGFGQSKELIEIAVSDASLLGLQPTVVTRRSILTAAGMLKDDGFVVKAWKGLVQARLESEECPDATDLYVLVKNAHFAGNIEFAKEEFEIWKDKLAPQNQYGIAMALEENGQEEVSDDAKSLDVTSLQSEIGKIQSDLEIMNGRTKDRPRVQDFRDQALPTTLLPVSRRTSLPESEKSKLYDQLTTEQPPSRLSNADKRTTPHIEASIERMETAHGTEAERHLPPTPALSPTNIAFSTLRYKNWKSINYLLQQSEASDKAYHNIVDKAIADGVVPPQHTLGLDLGDGDEVESYGLSDATPSGHDVGELGASPIQAARQEILRLRGRAS